MLPSTNAELINLNFEGGGGGACWADALQTAAISTPNINRNTTTITDCFTFARMSFLPFPRIKNKVLSVFTAVLRPGYFLAGQSNIEIKTLSTREAGDKTIARRGMEVRLSYHGNKNFNERSSGPARPPSP